MASLGREIHILWAGRHDRRPWEALCADYRKRLEREVPIRDQRIKAKVAGDAPERLRAEGEALLTALPDPCWTIVLDPRGRTLSSDDFAREMGRLHDEWPHPIAFLIGSDLGLDDSVIAHARSRLSFGSMIYGHQLARLMLYEQLYRSFSMRLGINYHRRSL